MSKGYQASLSKQKTVTPLNRRYSPWDLLCLFLVSLFNGFSLRCRKPFVERRCLLRVGNHLLSNQIDQSKQSTCDLRIIIKVDLPRVNGVVADNADDIKSLSNV